MDATIVVAVITCVGSIIGVVITSFHSSKKHTETMRELSNMTIYRIEQLEKKVEKHNGVMEKTIILERDMAVANHRISDLEGAQH